MRSFSKSLKEGISPIKVMINACKLSKKQIHTLDDFAENTGSSHDWFYIVVDTYAPSQEHGMRNQKESGGADLQAECFGLFELW